MNSPAANFVAHDDTRLAYWAPRPARRDPLGMRLERFAPEAQGVVAGQIGPLANLRSSSGCAVVFSSDARAITVHLERLRHHQPAPVQIALQWRIDAGPWHTVTSADLREREGSQQVWLASGLGHGQVAECWLWLPAISTCLFAGLTLHGGTMVEPISLPQPRWLAIGDSLTQGFNAPCPTTTWVHRVAQEQGLPCWNLGVGGLKIEPDLFAPALAARDWDLVTVALGSNHAWRVGDVETVAERAVTLADLLCAGDHRRFVWIMPPWKPCEEGLGPPEFFGVPLDRAAGARAQRIRDILEDALRPFTPRLEIVRDLMPHDHRLLADGLHPMALGMQRYAQAVSTALFPESPA